MSLPEYVDDAHHHASDEAYRGPAWYAVNPNGLVAGPFDDENECFWWIEKALTI